MINLIELYVKLVGLVVVGVILGRKLPTIFPTRLGQFLFWGGVPISIVAFLRKTNLSGQIWTAPAIAYLAILLGALLAWLWLKAQVYLTHSYPPTSTQGSLILASMVGNTGYIGFPITLAMVGKEYLAWALFYDLLGTLFGAYGLGVLLAARFSNQPGHSVQPHKTMLINPALWSFGFGLLFRQVTIPPFIEFSLNTLAWFSLALSLILIGMRLGRLHSLYQIKPALISILIKMLLVPLILGKSLQFFGVTGQAAQVIVLQMAMPPAFATVVLAETFDLDRDLAVTALALGVIVLLVTLPIWLWLF